MKYSKKFINNSIIFGGILLIVIIFFYIFNQSSVKEKFSNDSICKNKSPNSPYRVVTLQNGATKYKCSKIPCGDLKNKLARKAPNDSNTCAPCESGKTFIDTSECIELNNFNDAYCKAKDSNNPYAVINKNPDGTIKSYSCSNNPCGDLQNKLARTKSDDYNTCAPCGPDEIFMDNGVCLLKKKFNDAYCKKKNSNTPYAIINKNSDGTIESYSCSDIACGDLENKIGRYKPGDYNSCGPCGKDKIFMDTGDCLLKKDFNDAYCKKKNSKTPYAVINKNPDGTIKSYSCSNNPCGDLQNKLARTKSDDYNTCAPCNNGKTFIDTNECIDLKKFNDDYCKKKNSKTPYADINENPDNNIKSYSCTDKKITESELTEKNQECNKENSFHLYDPINKKCVKVTNSICIEQDKIFKQNRTFVDREYKCTEPQMRYKPEHAKKEVILEQNKRCFNLDLDKPYFSPYGICDVGSNEICNEQARILENTNYSFNEKLNRCVDSNCPPSAPYIDFLAPDQSRKCKPYTKNLADFACKIKTNKPNSFYDEKLSKCVDISCNDPEKFLVDYRDNTCNSVADLDKKCNDKYGFTYYWANPNYEPINTFAYSPTFNKKGQCFSQITANMFCKENYGNLYLYDPLNEKCVEGSNEVCRNINESVCDDIQIRTGRVISKKNQNSIPGEKCKDVNERKDYFLIDTRINTIPAKCVGYEKMNEFCEKTINKKADINTGECVAKSPARNHTIPQRTAAERAVARQEKAAKTAAKAKCQGAIAGSVLGSLFSAASAVATAYTGGVAAPALAGGIIGTHAAVETAKQEC